MDITWIAHSCFRLRDNEIVVVTDPFSPSIGFRADTRPASVVTISNTHPSHSDRDSVTGDPQVFDAPGEYEYSGIAVRSVMTSLPPDALQEQRNVAHCIQIDGINICHLGDITQPLTTSQIDDLAPIDVLLVPTGGGCTLGVEQVMQMMQDLNPNIVIPMHYNIPGLEVSLDGVDTFLRRMGVSDVQPQPRLSITQANITPNTRVVVLAAQARKS